MAKRLNKNGCQPTVHTSNSLIVPVHMHPSLGQTAAKVSTSLRAALSGKAWETKCCYSLTQVGINCLSSIYAYHVNPCHSTFSFCSQRIFVSTASWWPNIQWLTDAKSTCWPTLVNDKSYDESHETRKSIHFKKKSKEELKLLTPPNLRIEAGSSNRSSLIHALHVCGPALKEKKITF